MFNKKMFQGGFPKSIACINQKLYMHIRHDKRSTADAQCVCWAKSKCEYLFY